ncbi:MAG TPA: 1,2-phenylacetyl-CoA epoxidase subunit PaaC [Steroidobacteraceae bacterium]|nr:1,2-phenylacetyl-CoA epoxidase subunit PaaC [Steroidobacteraceae bacterium]
MSTPTLAAARTACVLRLADTNLVLAQRLGEWIGHAPALEEDLGLANLALDHLGQARLFYGYAAELEGGNRSEDDFAFLRDESAFVNLALAEQPNTDFAFAIVRQLLIDAYQLELYAALERSSDERLAQIAAKALPEVRYHLRYSSGWAVRLGDGTPESQRRMQVALEALWRFTPELFACDAIEQVLAAQSIAPDPAALESRWSASIDPILARATLQRPADASYPWYGKCGVHTEHLGPLLAQMQHLHRAHPGARW